jgi:hypothetical protein
MMRLLLCLLLLCSDALAIHLTGSMKAPDGSGITGRIEFSLSTQLSDTCNAGIAVPVRAGVVTVKAGVVDTSTDIVPSDCLSTPQPYTVNIYDGQDLVSTTRWWVAQTGAFVSGTGSRFLHIAGTMAFAANTQPAAYIMEQGHYHTVTQPVAVPASVSVNVTVTWPVPFASTFYTVGCTTKDAAGVLYAWHFGTISQKSAVVSVVNESTGQVTGTLTCNAREN